MKSSRLNRSLWVKLFTLTLFFGVCFIFSFYFYDHSISEDRINKIYANSLKQLSTNISLPLKIKAADQINRNMTKSLLFEDAQGIRVTTTDDFIIYDYGELNCGDIRRSQDVLYLNKIIGRIDLCIKKSEHILETRTIIFLVFGVLFVLIIGFAFFGVVRSTTKTVYDFINDVDNIDQDNLNFPTAPSSNEADGSIKELYSKMSDLIKKVEDSKRKLIKKRGEEALVQISTQVTHDIRSPLAALDAAAEFIEEDAEGAKSLIKMATERINNIASNLINLNKEIANYDKIEQCDLNELIDFIVQEKRLLFSKVDFEIKSSNLNRRVSANRSELLRVLSNLINNALESFDNQTGKISISHLFENDHSMILIADNGKGITEDILPKLGEKGYSFGKDDNVKSGSGLGLYHTFETLKKWNGKVEIESRLNEGTTIKLIF